MSSSPPPQPVHSLGYEPKRPSFFESDEVAYIAPMAIFLALTFLGGSLKGFYTWSYVFKTLLAAAALIYFRRHYTRIRWSHWQLGVIVGVIGIVQWIGMEKLLLHFWPTYPRPSVEAFYPHQHFANHPWQLWAFTAVRIAGAVLVVPFMEELFWRDYLWRTILAPNDFKLAAVGEFSWAPLLVVSIFFATVHVQWATAFVWGLMIGALLIHTRSLGACIIAHAVTNLLLAAYVLGSHSMGRDEWYFW
jgi:CAAX prenyl protease-like protein